MRKLIFILTLLFIVAGTIAAGRLVLESEWGFYNLTPTNLTGEKAIHIFPSSPASDDLDYSQGSSPGWITTFSENASVLQGTAEYWVSPNFASTWVGTNYVFDAGYAKLYWDGPNTRWAATVNGVSINKTDTFIAGEATHLVLRWETEGTDSLDLAVDGSSATPVTDAQAAGSLATIYVGQDSSNASVFNGRLAGRLLRRRISDSEIASLFSSGAGNLSTFTCSPDVFWMGTFSY